MKEVDIEGVKILFKNMTMFLNCILICEHDHVHMVNHSQKSRTGYLNKMINLL